MLKERQEAIKEALANRMDSNPHQDQWLRGQYYAYGELLGTSFSETQDAD